MAICGDCGGKGLPDGCRKCGAYYFGNIVTEEELSGVDYPMPAYYKRNQWDSEKLKKGDNVGADSVLRILDGIVSQTASGKELAASYAIMLSYGMGKKTAMFTIVQNYLRNKLTVAPIVDVAT